MKSKILAVGIILLFIGVSVSSAISVDSKPSISQDESEECSECRELSNADLVKVKQLINKVEVYSKLLLVLSRHNPGLKEISQEISNKISLLRNEFEDLSVRENICEFLSFLFFVISYYVIDDIMNFIELFEDSIIILFLYPIVLFFDMIVSTIFILYGLFRCYDYYYINSRISLEI